MPNNMIPKYPREIALAFKAADRVLFRVSDLQDVDKYVCQKVLERIDNCHIYFLCKRPRLSVVPGTLRTTDEFVHLDIEYKLLGKSQRVSTGLPRRLAPEHDLGVSPYPHRAIVGHEEDGITRVEILPDLFVHYLSGVPNIVKDFEVLYIGRGLKNSALDRLRNHRTLQKMVLDMNSNDPDSEVFALIYAFEMIKPNLSFLGIAAEVTGDAARRRWEKVLDYQPTVEAQVSLIEATCISYFQTRQHNTHYLRFPAGNYQMLAPVLAADFAALIVQIDHLHIGNLRIYSSVVQPNDTHNIIIDFRKLEGKASFFGNADN